MGQNFPWLSCSTIGPRETAGKKVRPPMMIMTPMVRPMNIALSVNGSLSPGQEMDAAVENAGHVRAEETPR